MCSSFGSTEIAFDGSITYCHAVANMCVLDHVYLKNEVKGINIK